MDIYQAMTERHSVRAFKDQPIEEEKITLLQKQVNECNNLSGLNIQLITQDKDAFNTMTAHYGKFSNAVNYFAITGKKSPENIINAGYYGQKLVLYAQTMGLNTCWVALTYNKKKNKILIKDNEKLFCVIALGYGVNQGNSHKTKSYEQVTENAQNAPEWFKKGVQAALLAPTAMNQQKFKFILSDNGVHIKRGLGFYTKLDLGIVKYHFETAAGKDNFKWV